MKEYASVCFCHTYYSIYLESFETDLMIQLFLCMLIYYLFPDNEEDEIWEGVLVDGHSVNFVCHWSQLGAG